jgi:two-component system cell cycle sensor histidine kinase/response regulator CckA
MANPPSEPPSAPSEAHRAADPFRLLVESIQDYAITMLDPAGRIACWNLGAERMTGYPAEEVLGRHVSICDTPEDPAARSDHQLLEKALEGGRHEDELLRVAKCGRRFWARVTTSCLRDEQGRHIGFAQVTRDITARRATEESLRASEERHRRLLELMPDAVFVNLDGRIAYGNAALAYLVGVPDPHHLVGHSVLTLFPEQDHDLIRQRIDTVKRYGVVPPLDERIVRQDGSVVPVEVVAAIIPYGGREAILVCLHDLSARKRAEAAAHKLAAIIDASDDAIIGLDLDGTISGWNEGAARLFGFPAAEVLGRDHGFMVPPDRRQEHDEILARARRGERVAPFDTVRIRNDGKQLDVSVSVSPVQDREGELAALCLVAQDIRERKRLQEQFRHAQKMEAVGRLAGGVAHDFNNLLTIISGYSELLLTTISDARLQGIVAEIKAAGERAAALTRQLLAFSRKQVLEPRVIEPNVLVADCERLLSRLLGEDIELKTSLAPGVGRVRVDAGQLEQVLINLAVNARDAMPQGGRLTIQTAEVVLDTAYHRTHPQVAPGPYVLISVSDSGHGMSEDVRARIFEPFFTTKEMGKGTGLGLAMVYGFVTQSGGHIDVYSEPGLGTTFKVYLPLVEGDAVAPSQPSTVPLPGGRETILLVEDDTAVRALARLTLEGLGYTVVEATNGHDALRVARAHAGPIHLLLTDVVMPGMGGRLAAETLAGTLPGLRVLFISGYTDDAVVRHGVLAAETEFLQKPFTPSALAHKVRQVLDAPPPRAQS